jgi:cyclopropane-fatty-acyl-phospholipid synthase
MKVRAEDLPLHHDHAGHVPRLRKRFAALMEKANVSLDGSRPWDIQVLDDRLYARVFARGSLGLGEAYMDGWWDCRALDALFERVLAADLSREVRTWRDVWYGLWANLINLQRGRRAFTIGKAHYDIGNDLFEAMLGDPMVYSCGYWRHAGNVEQAQREKLDLICRKLALEPGMRVLDIGCGWGAALKYAAENHGVEGVGLTVSREQADYARGLCEGLPVEIRLQDYREIDESFDRVFSIGMFEHVGRKNYPAYMDTVRRVLKPGGWSVLHTIGQAGPASAPDPWIARYIFPNSALPSQEAITRHAEGRFVIEDWHNFGPDYDKTLMAWHERFRAAWPDLRERYGERFWRMWRYYLLCCAGAFRARRLQLWQVILSPEGIPQGAPVVR